MKEEFEGKMKQKYSGLFPVNLFRHKVITGSAVVLLWFVLTLFFYNSPYLVLDNSLDSSNAAAYSYFTFNHFQYGTDVLHIIGPYGFVMFGYVYAGYLFWTRMILELLVQGALAFLVIMFILESPLRFLRWIWLLPFIALRWPPDLYYDSCILFAGIFLIQHPKINERPWPNYLVAGFLGFLPLCKGTLLTMAGFTLALVCTLYVLQGRKRFIPGLLAAFASVFVVSWVFAGQNLLHIPQYFMGIKYMTSGYNDAMSLQEGNNIFNTGIATLFFLILLICWTGITNYQNKQKVMICLLLLFCTFLDWKHGFVRADAHVQFFFRFAVIAALIDLVVRGNNGLQAGPPSDWRSSRMRFKSYVEPVLCLACIFFALIGVTEGRMNLGHLMSQPFITLKDNVAHVIGIRELKKDLDKRLDINRQKFNLPLVRKIVGNETIDFFGCEEGVVMLNGLNYRPLPMSVTFNTFNDTLERINRDHVLDPGKRPKYFLFKMATIDYRLLAQDDALALRAILDIYEPVLAEKGFLLFRQKARPDPGRELKMISSAALLPDNPVSLPVTAPDKVLYATAQLDLNWLGKLRSVFYKPPMLSLTMKCNGEHAEWNYRIIPTLMRMPVMVSWMLRDNADLVRILYGRSPREVRSLDLKVEPRMARFYKTDKFQVTFYEADRPREANMKIGRDLLLHFYPGFNIAPYLIDSPFPVDIHEIGDDQVLLVHAPGEIRFHLNGTEKTLSGDFGLLPSAYSDGGQTDGVKFKVSFMKKGPVSKVLFERMLMPVQFKKDQGRQAFKISLPKGQGAGTLSIATMGRNPGAPWGQSWLANIKVE